MPKEMNIRVACRCRPLNKLEKSMGGEKCVDILENTISVKVKQAGTEASCNKFVFDDIIGPNTTQAEVFERVAVPLLMHSMNGFNATIFAYGQTSSGKTYTMEGKNLNDPVQKGIIPRVMDRIFDLIGESDENLEFSLKVSMLEIYNEKIKDLLNPEKDNLKIKESKKRGIFVDDSTEVYVTSPEEMKKVMLLGAKNRSVAATRMNEVSSRSHSIFVMTIAQRDLTTGTSKDSRLYFVDLAGSEKISKTNAKGQTLNEAKNINKSLTSLGMVINQLALGKKGGYIPYRDSKLTRLLQDSLGGNSMTTLLVACSMCSYNDKETLTTLRFGQRAKTIKNKPKENVERSAKELMALLDKAENKINGYEELIVMLKGYIEQNEIELQEMEGYDKYLKFEKNKEKEKKKKGKKGKKKKKKEDKKEEITENNQEAEEGTKEAGFEEANLLEDEIKVKENDKTQDKSLLSLDISDEGKPKSDSKTSNVSEIMFSSSLIEDLNSKPTEANQNEIEKMKIQLLEKEQELTDMKDNMEFFEQELEELGSQNVLMMMKVETIHEVSKKVINEYHSQLLKIHSINQKQLLDFSRKESEIDHCYEDLESLKNLISNFEEESKNYKMGELSTIINPLVFEANSKFFDKTFEQTDSISELFGSVSSSFDQIFGSLSSNKIEIYDKLKIDLNLLNHQKYLDELLKITQNEDLDFSIEIDNYCNEDKKAEADPEGENIKEEDDELLNIMISSNSSEEKILELQKMVIAQKKKIENLSNEKAKIDADLGEVMTNYNAKIENMKEGTESNTAELKHDFEDQIEALLLEITKLKEDLQGYEEMKEQNKILEEEILNLKEELKEATEDQISLGNKKEPVEVPERLATEAGEENLRRMERYRKERNRYMDKVRDLKRSFVRKDEAYRDSLKNGEALKSILREQELEIESLREYIEENNKQVNVHQLINSKKVKTLRGGGGRKKKKVKLFSMNSKDDFSSYDESPQ